DRPPLPRAKVGTQAPLHQPIDLQTHVANVLPLPAPTSPWETNQGPVDSDETRASDEPPSPETAVTAAHTPTEQYAGAGGAFPPWGRARPADARAAPGSRTFPNPSVPRRSPLTSIARTQ